MICNLIVEDLIVNGQLTALANPDGTCKTPGCPHVAIGSHPRRVEAPAGNPTTNTHIYLLIL
jgi:hypothetical protein